MSDTPVIYGRTGTKGAEGAPKSSSSSFQRLDYLSIEDGTSKDVRFLIDAEDLVLDHKTNMFVPVPPDFSEQQREELRAKTPPEEYLAGYRTFGLHIMAPTRPMPADYQGKWPAKITAVCRHDISYRSLYNDCYICENYTEDGKPFPVKDRTWSLAVLRQMKVSGSTRVMEDVMEEVTERDANGVETVRMAPKIVIVQQANMNFWTTFSSLLGMYGTLLSRDFRIKRDGSGLSTKYSPAPFDESPDPLGEFDKFDLRNPVIRARYTIPDLNRLILDRSTDSFYGMWFDESKPHAVRSSKGDSAAEAPSNDIDPKLLSSLTATLEAQPMFPASMKPVS